MHDATSNVQRGLARQITFHRSDIQKNWPNYEIRGENRRGSGGGGVELNRVNFSPWPERVHVYVCVCACVYVCVCISVWRPGAGALKIVIQFRSDED